MPLASSSRKVRKFRSHSPISPPSRDLDIGRDDNENRSRQAAGFEEAFELADTTLEDTDIGFTLPRLDRQRSRLKHPVSVGLRTRTKAANCREDGNHVITRGLVVQDLGDLGALVPSGVVDPTGMKGRSTYQARDTAPALHALALPLSARNSRQGEPDVVAIVAESADHLPFGTMFVGIDQTYRQPDHF